LTVRKTNFINELMYIVAVSAHYNVGLVGIYIGFALLGLQCGA